MIAICFTYFRSLGLDNLRAALYSVRWQDLSKVVEIVVVDNNTDDTESSIQAMVSSFHFPVPVRVLSAKHGNPVLTHSWSMNLAIRQSSAPWVFYTRADYLLDPRLLWKLLASQRVSEADFVTSDGYHLNLEIQWCDQFTTWRTDGPSTLLHLSGSVIDYGVIDSGVALLKRSAFDLVGGLDETLTAWGHSQTDFQYRLSTAGVSFDRVSEVLFYHPQHAAERDIALAHEQLRAKGVEPRDMWKRHLGEQPYR